MPDVSLSASAQALCLWTDDSKRFFLYADPDVINRIGVDVWTAFKKVPRRGLEIGGILLGHSATDGDIVNLRINDYQLVDSEHRFGPSYLLSDTDFSQLLGEVEKHGAATLGIFRSQTRSEGLEIERSDVETLEQCFASGNPLFLVLAPAARKAAFFARVEGQLKPVHEFPLSRLTSAILSAGPSTVRVPEVARPAEPVQPPATELASLSRALQNEPAPPAPDAPVPERPARRSGLWREWLFAAAAIALLLAGAALGGLIRIRRPSSAPAAAPAFVRLKVQPAGSSLQLTWDPNAAELKGATHAALHIQDGSRQIDRELAPADLKIGTLSYDPKGADVIFRLDVYTAAPSASGVVEALEYKEGPSKSTPQPDDSAARIVEQPAISRSPDSNSSDSKSSEPERPSKDGLGFSMQAIPPDMARTLHLSEPYGALVSGVTPESPAAIGGLKRGDVILSVDDERIKTFRQLDTKLRGAHPVKPTTLWILSNGATREIKVAPEQ